MYASDESGFKHRISSSEWLKVEKICGLLKLFNEITNAFSGTEYPTANLYFYNIWKIQRLLLSAIDGGDTNISQMTTQMYEKFDKYWHDFSHILSFVVILDPRYKYDFVLYALKKLHGDVTGINKANVIYRKFLELYKDYEKKVSPTSTVTENYEDYGCGDLESWNNLVLKSVKMVKIGNVSELVEGYSFDVVDDLLALVAKDEYFIGSRRVLLYSNLSR
ncbi:zinc finger BED domain-containing protein RICESLEEPER 2-like [Silene latifolia]|uniref:zinc finger BED domain-containing protein RICESLEEPER 2-like n=1 Tax=Silene latifolia TaxID=37657 RepID=UPI003D76B024